MHQQEQARLQVLNSLLAEEITIGQAAELMDLSERHARRLLGAYRELGAEALAHGNRGRGPITPSPRWWRLPSCASPPRATRAPTTPT